MAEGDGKFRGPEEQGLETSHPHRPSTRDVQSHGAGGRVSPACDIDRPKFSSGGIRRFKALFLRALNRLTLTRSARTSPFAISRPASCPDHRRTTRTSDLLRYGHAPPCRRATDRESSTSSRTHPRAWP